MSAIGARRDAHRRIAFLRDADQRDGAAGHRMIGHHDRTLIEHELRLHSPPCQQARGLRGATAARLLVVSEHEEHRARRLAAGPDQGLRRFEHRHQRTLVVDGTAAEDRRIGDRAGERRMRPAVGRSSRHHILVRHQDDGRQREVAARPFIQQRAGTEGLAHRLRVNRGIGLRQPLVEPRQPGCAGLRLIVRTNGLEADGLTQVTRSLRQVEGQRRHRHRLHGRMTTRHCRPPRRHRDEHDDQQREGGQRGPPRLPCVLRKRAAVHGRLFACQGPRAGPRL